MSVSIKLAVVGLLAVGIVAGGWTAHRKGYKAGEEAIRKEYAAAATTAALSAVKTLERLQDAVQKAGERHEIAKRQIKINAANADSELGRLRDELAARASASGETAGGPSRADGTGAERELLGICAATLVDLAKEADRIESKLTGLQDYVEKVVKRCEG